MTSTMSRQLARLAVPLIAATNLRQSARANLHVLLGNAVDTVRFTPQGLRLR
ncbi:hypothetical protein [Roseateles sp. DXS20W]